MRKTVVSILIFLLIVAAGLILWANFVFLNNTLYPRNLETLDLSGKPGSNLWSVARLSNLKQADLRGTGLTAEQYAYIRDALPECEILWDVPCLGSYYSLETRAIRLNALSEKDLAALDFLPRLVQVDAAECRDYDALMELQRRHPQCLVQYTVSIGGTEWASDSTALCLNDADVQELTEKLAYMPETRKVLFTGRLPSPEDLLKMQEAYPKVLFSCEWKGQQIAMDRNTTRLELSDTPLTAEEAETLLRCFPNLEEAEMLNCGLTDPEMLALCDRFPNCHFVWEITIADVPVRTDAEEIDLSWHEVDVQELEDLLPRFPNVERIIMCECGIDSEEMDALNQRHEDIRFIWQVHMGNVSMRTDAIYFAPVVTGDSVTTWDLDDLKYCTDVIAVDIGHMDVTSCEWAAYMPNLQYLIIADTPISDITPLTGLKKLVFLEMFLTSVRDYSPLLTCTGLEDLNLCFTYGTSEDVRQMTWLKRLWWDGNWAAVQGLEEYLPDTEMNFHSGSSTGGTWRAGAHYKEQRDILGMPYFYG